MHVKYDKHYSESDRACGEPFKPFVDFVAGQTRQLRVLDLGCGQGRDALLFARGGHDVVGVDLSSVGIGQLQATARAESLAIHAEVADIAIYQPVGTFDVVVLDRVLHMLPSDSERRSVLDRAVDSTRHGGFVLVSEYPKQRALLRSYFEKRPAWTARLDQRGFMFVQRTADSSGVLEQELT